MIKILNFILRIIRFFERKNSRLIQKLRDSKTDTTTTNDLILVIGAHRSGTSVFTQILSILGYDLGKTLMLPSFDNPRGFWENQEIVGIHEKLLNSFDKNWTTAGFLPDDWYASDFAIKTISKLEDVLAVDFNKKDPCLIKDPRLCMLLPLWQTIAERQNYVLKPLIIIRSPEAIAASISRRNGISLDNARTIAISYLRALCTLPESGDTSILVYEKIMHMRGGEILDLFSKEGILPESYPYQTTVNQINQIIKTDKVNSNFISTPTQNAYEKLIKRLSPTITLDELREFIAETSNQEQLKQQLISHSETRSFLPNQDIRTNVSKEKYDVIVAENDRYIEKLDVLSASKFQLTRTIAQLMTLLEKERPPAPKPVHENDLSTENEPHIERKASATEDPIEQPDPESLNSDINPQNISREN